EEELVADGLAGDGRARGEDLCHRGRVGTRRLLRREPLRVAAARARAGDVVEVLHGRREPGERPAGAAGDRRLDVVRDVERAGRVRGHVDFPCARWITSSLAVTASSAVTMPAIMSQPELWPMPRIAATAASASAVMHDDTAAWRHSPTWPAAATRRKQRLSGDVSPGGMWLTARARFSRMAHAPA